MDTLAKNVLAALLAVGALTGCQQVTYPDGRVGYSISPANLVAGGPASPPARPGQEANDPMVTRIMPTETVLAADRRFYDIGLYNLPAFLNRCATDAGHGRRDVAECWALDVHALIVNTAETNVRHRPPVPGLDQASAKRRWHVYASALGVSPDRYQTVEDGVFQRVYAVAVTPH